MAAEGAPMNQRSVNERLKRPQDPKKGVGDVLSDRRQRVLTALVKEYVARALPIGSRTLVERYHLGVSSATVRNDLSALEDAGYITQPHTSAGRIPTDSGYRAFVDELLASDALRQAHPHADLVSQLRASASELDRLLEQTSEALTRLTDCLSVVMAPSLLTAHLRQISLVSLSDFRALIVVVAEDGQVVNRQISFSESVSAEELDRVSALLNETFVGKSLQELQGDDDPAIVEAFRDPLASLILNELVALVNESGLGRTHRVGMSSLLAQPEFATSNSIVPVMRWLEDEEVLLHAFDGAWDSDVECVVRIGSENSATELAGVSVVAGRYGRGASAGIVAVIGPTRMDYPRVIKAVRAAREVLEES